MVPAPSADPRLFRRRHDHPEANRGTRRPQAATRASPAAPQTPSPARCSEGQHRTFTHIRCTIHRPGGEEAVLGEAPVVPRTRDPISRRQQRSWNSEGLHSVSVTRQGRSERPRRGQALFAAAASRSMAGGWLSYAVIRLRMTMSSSAPLGAPSRAHSRSPLPPALPCRPAAQLEPPGMSPCCI